jgi:AcrR family transcriptional regulator
MPNGTGTATSEQAILAAARAEFERYGVRRTAMDDIARRAGISRSTLYRRSPAKEALFERLVFEVAGSLRRSGVTLSDEDVRAVAEILIRLTMSILLNPEGQLDISDSHAVRRYPQRYLARLVR